MNRHSKRPIAEAEASAAGENWEHADRLTTAAAESGFSGWLRRVIHRDPRPIEEFALAIAVDVDRLEEFLAGETPLTSDEVDRVVNVLGLTMAEQTAADDARSG
jgi:hypothetical protein